MNHHKSRHGSTGEIRLIHRNQKVRGLVAAVECVATRGLNPLRSIDGIPTGHMSYKRNMVNPMDSRLISKPSKQTARNAELSRGQRMLEKANAVL